MGARRGAVRWRSRLRRELVWLMLLKVAALALLWGLFFSPAHRPDVDAQAASLRLGVAVDEASAAARVPRPGAVR